MMNTNISETVEFRKKIISESLFNPGSMKEVVVLLTPVCNLNCSYCYENDQWKKKKTEVNLPKILEVLDMYMPETIVFLGGNSFSNEKELKTICDRYPSSKIRMYVDARWLDKLKPYVQRYDTIVDISIDPAWETRFESKDEWNRAIDNITPFVIDNLDKVTLNLVLTKYGYDWNMFRDRIHNDVRIYAKAVCLEENANLEPLESEWPAIRELIVGDYDRKVAGLSAISQIDRYLTRINTKHNFRCSCGVNRVTVDWRGDLSFCDGIPLSTRWNDKFKDKEIIIETLSNYAEKCVTCEYVQECGGACVLLDPPNKFYCFYISTIIDVGKKYLEALPDRREIYLAAAGGRL